MLLCALPTLKRIEQSNTAPLGFGRVREPGPGKC
jgi:hypothetical protein